MVNVKRLRCFIGWLAIALPILVAVLLWRVPSSISSTYYTYEAGPVFMIVLGMASGFLLYYDGYSKFDDIINTLAGVCGLLICLFPCWSNLPKVGTFQISADVSAIIHNVAAVVFFIILAFISAFQFTKSNGNKSKKKKIRNVIYIVCAIGMLASFAILLLPKFRIQVWLVEAIALFFFGVSWLTKANAYTWLAAEKE